MGCACGTPCCKGCNNFLSDLNFETDFDSELEGVYESLTDGSIVWETPSKIHPADSGGTIDSGDVDRHIRMLVVREAGATIELELELGSAIDGNAIGPISGQPDRPAFVRLRLTDASNNGAYITATRTSTGTLDDPIVVSNWFDSSGTLQEDVYDVGAEFAAGDTLKIEIVFDDEVFPIDVTYKFYLNATLIHSVAVTGIAESGNEGFWSACKFKYDLRISRYDVQDELKVDAMSLETGLDSFGYPLRNYTTDNVKFDPADTINWVFAQGVALPTSWNPPTEYNDTFDSFVVAGGSLPTGVSINSTDGTFSGTPTDSSGTTGRVNIKATADTSGEDFSTGFYEWEVADERIVTYPDPFGSPSGSNEWQFDWNQSNSMSPTIGGFSPDDWTLETGSLPTGMSINSTSGDITGTPSVNLETGSCSIRASDGTFDVVTVVYDWEVAISV